MRVIAGSYRSRKIETLRGLALRPSSDRLRETLFDILGPAVQGAVFVDLFAGSGAVGIEAISRGAAQAIFAENHPAGIQLLRRNLASLGIPLISAKARSERPGFSGAAEILAGDAIAALDKLAFRRVRPGFIFADPPYDRANAYTDVLDFLEDSDLLNSGGLLILEHARRRELPATVGRLERARLSEQGDAALSFYRAPLVA